MLLSAMTKTPQTRKIFLEDQIDKAVAYAALHAVQVLGSRSSEDGGERRMFEIAPVSLFPNPVPAAVFSRARSLAQPNNLLVDRLSRDGEFLQRSHEGIDPSFTGRLCDLHRRLYLDDTAEGVHARSADRLGILRSDYMWSGGATDDDGESDVEPPALKQIELNTIASSFAGLSTRVTELHQHLSQRLGNNNAEKEVNLSLKGEIPNNQALPNLARALKLALDRYISRHYNSDDDDGKVNQEVAILFVVQEGESNVVDQWLLEDALWNLGGTKVVRLSLAEVESSIALEPDTGRLMLRATGQEMGVIYFRAGYTPTDYVEDDENRDSSSWRGRVLLERSRATKCPNLAYHLCGTKKIQQILARPGVLERYVDPSSLELVRQSFVGLHSLSPSTMTDIDRAAVSRVLEEGGDAYVLKPQREGGGNNLYGSELASFMRQHARWHYDASSSSSTDKRLVIDPVLADDYILMERIFPPAHTAVLLRGGRPEGTGPCVSELGVYGCILSSASGQILHNECSGHLLRTKFLGVDEGGVASGFATLSSPLLEE